jgi:hypothetical protein
MTAIRPVMMFLIAGVGIIAGWSFYGADLLRDFDRRNHAFVPAIDLTIRSAECTNYWFLITGCSVEYQPSSAGEKQSLSYMFLGPTPEKRFQLLRSAEDRGIVVADVGLAHLWNRILCLAVFSAGLVLVAFAGVRLMAAA